MTEQRLLGKRVLVTQADDYMGPATLELFREHGAEVLADTSDLRDPERAAELVAEAGTLDVLVANLAAPANVGVLAPDIDDELWHTMFDRMVHPLHRLCRATLPGMIERHAGKIVVYGSATGVKAFAGVSANSAARAAQVGYVLALESCYRHFVFASAKRRDAAST